MQKVKDVLRQFEFHLLLFVAALILFLRPLLVASEGASPNAMMWSLFLSWVVVIVLVLFASYAYRAGRAGDERVMPRDDASHEETEDRGD